MFYKKIYFLVEAYVAIGWLMIHLYLLKIVTLKGVLLLKEMYFSLSLVHKNYLGYPFHTSGKTTSVLFGKLIDT